LNAIFDAAFLHRIFEPSGDAVGEAENQHGFAGRPRQVFGAKSQAERLSGSGDATNDSVPFAQAARHLLLVQVHDFEDPVFRRRGLRFQRKRDLSDPDLGD
jgi:hypothetical protein